MKLFSFQNLFLTVDSTNVEANWKVSLEIHKLPINGVESLCKLNSGKVGSWWPNNVNFHLLKPEI